MHGPAQFTRLVRCVLLFVPPRAVEARLDNGHEPPLKRDAHIRAFGDHKFVPERVAQVGWCGRWR